MKILVTGATGLIGNQVVRTLVERNIEIIATSRNIEKTKRYSWFSKVKYIPCDINENRDDFFVLFQRPDIMIHLAWEGLENYNDLFHIEKNVPAHYGFIKNMVLQGLKHVVVAGTCLEYGMQNGCLAEKLETKPTVPYALAKDTLRKYLVELFKVRPVTFQWTRLFYMHGEGQNENSLFGQLEKAIRNGEKKFNMSGGEQLRDYLPVTKVAEYIATIALQNHIQGCINCCSGRPISVRKLIENHLKEKACSMHLNLGYYPYPGYEPMAFWGDNHKLQDILDPS
jgi:dTDP-6-deoxy-L-talose 4-dehydrogenase (NAD+)